MSLEKLKNAPLKEVVFELHWSCEVNTYGEFEDKGFDLAQGKFASKLEENFPLHRKIMPDGAPFKIFGAPIHQYWKGEFMWPVVQHGQGMIAINEVESGYEWVSFKALISDSISKLKKSYEHNLNFCNVKLQYIDAFDLDNESPMDFITNNLQTKINTDYILPGELKGINIQQVCNLEDSSVMELNISNGINNNNQKESIVWTTTITKKESLTFEQLIDWIDVAHNVASSFFKNMLNPTFYDSLDR